MTKIIQIVLVSIFIFCFNATSFAQQTKSNDPDMLYKEALYAKNKKEVLSYNIKEFDELFFEYLLKSKDSNTLLSKEEYYTYTIKIAIYSEKLGLLYKNKKQEAQQTKEQWFEKKYQDYLNERSIKK